MKKLLLGALPCAFALFVSGCAKEEPQDVDLTPKTDVAEDIAAGRDVPADKVIPKDDK